VSYFDTLADTRLDPDRTSRTLGTLLFATSWPVKFVLEPETWPVFLDWYRKQFDGADFDGQLDGQGKLELTDMLHVMNVIAMSGTP
jgi:hypothetical protein